MPILYSLVRQDRGSNPQFTTLESITQTITVPTDRASLILKGHWLRFCPKNLYILEIGK
jgi:hypothetical protein